jgi:NCS1 family nucleobase:cation symporter-1
MDESAPSTPGDLADFSTAVVEQPDGRVELQDDRCITGSSLYNHDLAPIPVSGRKWTTYNYAALWVAMSACIPTYMLSSGLMASGMNWWQAIVTILLGNIIVLIPILLNSHPGTKYGIPFPVFARAAYGTNGSNLPAIMRALVACGWFGIQSWIGGSALYSCLSACFPQWKTLFGADPVGGYQVTQWVSFAIFWGINILIIYRGMDLLKKFQGFAAPFVMIMTTVLLFWSITNAHGLGNLLSNPGKLTTFSTFFPVFIPSLTAIIGFWATLSLNMPDFTRFGRSQREQTIGQMIALPTAMTIFSTMAVIITSASEIIYPHVSMDKLWDPINLVSLFDSPVLVTISMFTVAVATLSVNIAANVVSPANDFANAFPRWISFKTGGLITGVLGVILQPWKLVADPSGFIYAWLQGYSGGLGAIAGVLVADYWLVRKKKLALADLYLHKGEYEYTNGWNWKAVAATVIGCFFAWIGAFVPALKPMYDYAWFVGFAISAVIYCAAMRR